MKLFKTLFAAGLLALAASVAFSAPAAAFKISTANGSAQLDAQKTLSAGGTLVFYDGTEPTDPDTAVSTQNALATFTLNSPACGSDSTSGSYRVCTMSFAATTVTASHSGTATWARVYESNGTTADEDFTVGTSGQDINFDTNVFSSGGNVSITGSGVLLKQPIH